MVVILNLKKFLKNNKNARKIFGKKELKIIFKQLDGITLTQSEKNRLSRDIRQKLEFIKELNQFKYEFKLKKDQNNLQLIDKVVGTMINDEFKKNIEAIFLFGSRVKGVVTHRSDIDICAVFNKDVSLQESTKFRIRVLRDLPDKVDVQVFNVLPQKLKRAIAANHKILYKDKFFDNTSFK